jgi:hypothetical protein
MSVIDGDCHADSITTRIVTITLLEVNSVSPIFILLTCVATVPHFVGKLATPPVEATSGRTIGIDGVPTRRHHYEILVVRCAH